jgi:hypothetical protein
MTSDRDDVVCVFSGPPELVEERRSVLAEAGVASRVVGTELSGSFGSVLPQSVELWVHAADVERAQAAIAREAEREPRPHFPHPTDAPKPRPAPNRKEPYVNPDPGS